MDLILEVKRIAKEKGKKKSWIFGKLKLEELVKKKELVLELVDDHLPQRALCKNRADWEHNEGNV